MDRETGKWKVHKNWIIAQWILGRVSFPGFSRAKKGGEAAIAVTKLLTMIRLKLLLSRLIIVSHTLLLRLINEQPGLLKCESLTCSLISASSTRFVYINLPHELCRFARDFLPHLINRLLHLGNLDGDLSPWFMYSFESWFVWIFRARPLPN